MLSARFGSEVKKVEGDDDFDWEAAADPFNWLEEIDELAVKGLKDLEKNDLGSARDALITMIDISLRRLTME